MPTWAVELGSNAGEETTTMGPTCRRPKREEEEDLGGRSGVRKEWAREKKEKGGKMKDKKEKGFS